MTIPSLNLPMDALPPFHIPHRKHHTQLLHQLIRAQLIINPGQTETDDMRRVVQSACALNNDVSMCIQMGYLVAMTIDDPLLFNFPAIRAECGDDEEFGCHSPSES